MATNSEKKEKSLAEFIAIITLVGVMMAVFINYFIKNEAQFSHAGFATLAQNFNTKVNVVHAQWLMDKQPNTVLLTSFNEKEKQGISVNKAGWVDVNQKHLACEAIWLLIMEIPINLMQYSIKAVESYKNSNAQHNKTRTLCKYVLLDGRYFSYNRANGKVSKVIDIN